MTYVSSLQASLWPT